MSLTADFLRVAAAFADAAGIEMRTLSSRALNDGKVLPGLQAGQRTISLARAEDALVWFSENWPEGADWPADIPRPVREAEEPQHEVDRAA